MSCVSGLYSIKPGGVNRLMGWLSPLVAPPLQQPPFDATLTPFCASIQQPLPPLALDMPHFWAPLLPNDWAASSIGRYPVHRQRFPSNASSISCSDGSSLLRRRAYKLMTIPGVQKPHWDPFPFAILSCAGCGFLTFPMPSTVITCLPSTLTSGAKQALTDAWYIFFVVGLYCETTTVQAPQPPSAHPSFVPVKPMPRRYSSNVTSGSAVSRTTFVPLR